MNKAETLKTVRNLTPDAVLFSPAGRLKIALLQLVARLLPGRSAVWLSLLNDGRLERQVRIKLGPRSLFPGNSGYDVPRLHLIVERRDWLALQEDALQAIQQSPDSPPSPQEQPKSGLSLKPIFDLLRPLVYEFQDDPTTFNVEDEFLFGQAVLAAPILTDRCNALEKILLAY